jgi:hypothetical protein
MSARKNGAVTTAGNEAQAKLVHMFAYPRYPNDILGLLLSADLIDGQNFPRLVVVSVAPNSIAYEAGIFAGDILVRVQSATVDSILMDVPRPDANNAKDSANPNQPSDAVQQSAASTIDTMSAPADEKPLAIQPVDTNLVLTSIRRRLLTEWETRLARETADPLRLIFERSA